MPNECRVTSHLIRLKAFVRQVIGLVRCEKKEMILIEVEQQDRQQPMHQSQPRWWEQHLR
jgi:hypothetical protein